MKPLLFISVVLLIAPSLAFTTLSSVRPRRSGLTNQTGVTNPALCFGPVSALVDKYVTAINQENYTVIEDVIDYSFRATVSGLEYTQTLNRTEFLALHNVWFRGNFFLIPTVHWETQNTGAFSWKEGGFWVSPKGNIHPWLGKETVHFVDTTEDGTRLLRYRIFLPNYQQTNGSQMIETVLSVFNGINNNSIAPLAAAVAPGAFVQHCNCGDVACDNEDKAELSKELLEEFQLAVFHNITLSHTYVSANFVCTAYDNLMRLKDGSEIVVLSGLGCYELAGDGNFSIVKGKEYRNVWARGPRPNSTYF